MKADGISCFGSKRRIAHKIYSTISGLHPDKNVFVDLFCGGFAVSEYFLKNGWRVIANDKNKYIVALLKRLVFGGLDEKVVFDFVSREKFFDVIKNPDKYEDWYVGFVSNTACGDF